MPLAVSFLDKPLRKAVSVLAELLNVTVVRSCNNRKVLQILRKIFICVNKTKKVLQFYKFYMFLHPLCDFLSIFSCAKLSKEKF